MVNKVDADYFDQCQNLGQQLDDIKLIFPDIFADGSRKKLIKQMEQINIIRDDNLQKMKSVVILFKKTFKSLPWIYPAFMSNPSRSRMSSIQNFIRWRINIKQGRSDQERVTYLSNPLLHQQDIIDKLKETPVYFELVMRYDNARMILNENDIIIRHLIMSFERIISNKNYLESLKKINEFKINRLPQSEVENILNIETGLNQQKNLML